MPSTGLAKRQPGAVWVRCHQGRAAQRLVDRDQRHGGGEGHLEAGLHQALRRDDEHDQRRERDRAHGQRRPVEQHRDEHGRGHHVGALRRHLGAGDRRGRPRRRRAPRTAAIFFSGQCSASQRHQRQAVADDARRPPPRAASCAGRRSRRCGRGSRPAAPSSTERSMPERSPVRIAAAKAPSCPGTCAWMCAEAAMRSRKASWRQARAVRALGLEHRRAGVADRADPLEPGDAAEVEAAGLGRRRRRRRAAPGRGAAGPARSTSAGVAGSSEIRTRAGVSRRLEPVDRPPGRAAPAAGRSPSGRGRSTRPSTFAVISWASTGAATARVRSAAAPKPSAGRSSREEQRPAPTGAGANERSPTPTRSAPRERREHPGLAARPAAAK